MIVTAERPVLLCSRIAGFAYLIVIVAGLFVQLAVLQPLVGGSAETTGDAIAGSELRWRIGILVSAIGLIANVPLGVILYGFFKRLRPTLARCALAFILVCTTMEAGNLPLLCFPLAMGYDVEGRAIAYAAIHLHMIGLGLALLFFAGFCILTGVLIIRSTIVPRLLGVMMVAAGLCYALNTIAMIGAPSLWSEISPGILLPCLVAEASLAIWLLIKGAVGSDMCTGAGG